MDKILTVHYNNDPIYDIVISADFNSLLTNLNKQGIINRRICVITDSHVGSLYLNTILNIINNNCSELYSYTFPEGEQNKTLDTVKDIYKYLIDNHFDRNDLLIALGGGVTGDITGFVAATYLRGIDFIQLPTSLLSQVDSSIGGKTGVDFDSYKNMVGAFHQPKLVYVNISTLNTLDNRQFISGMGELIKHGLIKDKDLYDFIYNNSELILHKETDILSNIIYDSLDIKRIVVERDPKEQNERALLNYGHTLGHAVEKFTNFEYTHGECVAFGCILASILSYNKGYISKESVKHIIEAFDKFGFPHINIYNNVNDIIRITKSDKKMVNGSIKFIMLSEIGNSYIDKTISDDDMKECIINLYKEFKYETC